MSRKRIAALLLNQLSSSTKISCSPLDMNGGAFAWQRWTASAPLRTTAKSFPPSTSSTHRRRHFRPQSSPPFPPSPRLLSTWTSSKPGLVITAAAAAAAEDEGKASLDRTSQEEATTSTSTEETTKPRQRKTTLPPGAFAHLPVVPPSDEHFAVATRRAQRVRADPKIKNEAARARSWAARRLDALGKELCTPLGKMEGRYESTLARVDAGRRATLQAAKEAASAASKCKTKKEALEAEAAGAEAVEKAWKAKAASPVDSLKEVAKSLRRLPVVDADSPTLALVGAPNVGKSSLVRALSSGEPAVADYPFTTRSVALGHFYVGGSSRRQVTDTPGLLRRPQEDRNAMELLTLACLDHLPCVAVAFVSDGTGLCGTSVADQWALREELRAKYREKLPWVDVLTKADLLEEEFRGAAEGEEEESGDNENDAGNDETGVVVVRNAEELSRALPRAVRVSTPLGKGIDELKVAVLEAMEKL